ncbi:hypothetical protein HPB47_021949 [Ixodes persulcatus]|uniref:Uncharacterized protein n=1 Tax=Ixodes persulcatus TaxID=34615 RepID=A0AC60QEG2_IXOPE|nr:hypothetical protein HPB47_021949 [Ixodes persulcatus]
MEPQPVCVHRSPKSAAGASEGVQSAHVVGRVTDVTHSNRGAVGESRTRAYLGRRRGAARRRVRVAQDVEPGSDVQSISSPFPFPSISLSLVSSISDASSSDLISSSERDDADLSSHFSVREAASTWAVL